MIERSVYDIAMWPTGASYESLIRGTAAIAFYFGLVIRPNESRLSESARDLLSELTPQLVTTRSVAAWPGSELLPGSPLYAQHLYLCGPDSVDILVSAAQSLGDWVNPYLPEDLHFLREDESVVLGSVAQERFVWAELSDAEFEMWSSQLSADLREQVMKRAD